MEKRKTKIIIRENCPETNSSSSHSFVLSREKFKPEDLKLATQTLIPGFDEKSGKSNVVVLDGLTDSYERERKINDSKLKAAYLIASLRYILGTQKKKEDINKVKEIIKKNTGADEVIIRNESSFEIDHQSHQVLESLIKSKDPDIYEEFIFNPRIWVYLLWDSEDDINNQIYSSSGYDYFKYEVSVKLPIVVQRFREDPRIDEIDFTILQYSYPTIKSFDDIQSMIFTSNFIEHYDDSVGGFNKIDNKDGVIDRICLRRSYYNESKNDPNYYELFGVLGIGDKLHFSFIRSDLWIDVYNNLIKIFPGLRIDESDSDKFPEIEALNLIYLERELANLRQLSPDQYARYIVTTILNYISPLFTKSILKILGISEDNLKIFPINIYSREENYVY